MFNLFLVDESGLSKILLFTILKAVLVPYIFGIFFTTLGAISIQEISIEFKHLKHRIEIA